MAEHRWQLDSFNRLQLLSFHSHMTCFCQVLFFPHMWLKSWMTSLNHVEHSALKLLLRNDDCLFLVYFKASGYGRARKSNGMPDIGSFWFTEWEASILWQKVMLEFSTNHLGWLVKIVRNIVLFSHLVCQLSYISCDKAKYSVHHIYPKFTIICTTISFSFDWTTICL